MEKVYLGKRSEIELQSEADNEDQVLKKLKISVSSLSENIQKLEITDNSRIIKSQILYPVRKYLEWIFLNEGKNPLWVRLSNRKKIKNMVLIFLDDVNGNDLELAVRSNLVPFLSDYLKVTSHIAVPVDNYFKKDSVWCRIFNIPKVSKQCLVKTSFNSPKYSNYCLTDIELLMNRYPMDLRFEHEIFEDSGNISKWKLLEKKPKFNELLAIDCEMVETKNGFELARITIINSEYEEIYNKYVKPKNTIINYHYKYSGIKKESLTGDGVLSLSQVQKDLRNIFDKNTILVGHSLENDLRAMRVKHRRVIDTALLYSTKTGKKLSLKHLSSTHLKYKIQNGTHDSLEDAKAALALLKYRADIIDKLGLSLQVGDDRFLKKIAENFKLIILDVLDEIKPILDYGIMFEECVDTSLSTISNLIIKYLDKDKGPNSDLIFSKIKVFSKDKRAKEGEHINEQQRYKELSEALEKVYKAAPDDTAFIISTLTQNETSGGYTNFGHAYGGYGFNGRNYSPKNQGCFNSTTKYNSLYTFVK